MDANNAPYVPISCQFHDQLEILATYGTAVPIFFRDRDGVLQARNSSITDVFSRDGAEFLSMATGESIRLDQLAAVNGKQLASFPAESAWCAA